MIVRMIICDLPGAEDLRWQETRVLDDDSLRSVEAARSAVEITFKSLTDSFLQQLFVNERTVQLHRFQLRHALGGKDPVEIGSAAALLRTLAGSFYDVEQEMVFITPAGDELLVTVEGDVMHLNNGTPQELDRQSLLALIDVRGVPTPIRKQVQQ